jgi:CRP-like cAMP-binding protein/rhodanese-related sulfurtransferase
MELTASDLRKYNYFSCLSGEALGFISSNFKQVRYPAGSCITKEGDEGEAFYFIQDGRLEVSKKGRSGNDVFLSVIGSGLGFGEMALLTYAARSTSVRAATDSVVLRLSKPVFEKIVSGELAFKSRLLQNIRDYTRYNKVKTLQPFELLEPEKVYVAIEKMVEKTYLPGDDIIVQGEKGDNYYIIKSGSVAVLKKKKGEQETKKIVELGSGDAFGEEALIRDDPRNATCRAMEETTVYTLTKQDFNLIVKSVFLENIFPEDVNIDTYLDEYVIIDARIPLEYEEEHIYGALNIPVEVLRQKCVGFDPGKKYITYCLNDSRGMVAAFLLKNRGFNARCLRGGVSGWLGKVESGSDSAHMA